MVKIYDKWDLMVLLERACTTISPQSGINRLFQALDLHWRLAETGDVQFNARHSLSGGKKTRKPRPNFDPGIQAKEMLRRADAWHTSGALG
jgi:hypothetical protein